MSIFVHSKRKKILEGLGEKNPNPYTKNRTVPLTVGSLILYQAKPGSVGIEVNLKKKTTRL